MRDALGHLRKGPAAGPAAPKAWLMHASNMLLAGLVVLVVMVALPNVTANRVYDLAAANWWILLVAFFAWGLASRVASAILRRGAPDAPGWIFLVNGWVAVTIAAGLTLPFDLVDIRTADQLAADLARQLGIFAVIGVLWTLLVDYGRIVTWRISRRPEPSLLTIATLAAVAGVVAAGVVIGHVIDGAARGSPATTAQGLLGTILASGFALTLVVELPRAIAVRRMAGSGGASGDGGKRPVRTIGAPSDMTRSVVTARDGHGAIATPPTIVRRR